MKNFKISILTITTLALIAVCGKTAESGKETIAEQTSVVSETETSNTKWYSNNPKATLFTISNADELAGLAQIVNGTWGGTPERDDFSGKTVRLTRNVDLSKYDNWAPIGHTADIGGRRDSGKDSKSFSGTFDGGGFVIGNLTINRPDSGIQGLFGYISGGTVKNLGLDNVDIRGGKHAVGGVAGFIDSSTVSNSWVAGKISGGDNIGGVVGYARGDIQSGGTFGLFVNEVGGGRGGHPGGNTSWHIEKKSGVVNSYFTGTVSGSGAVGGVVGAVDKSNVLNCYSTGVVSGGSSIGGVVGVIHDGSNVANSYTTSTVIGNSCVGGVAGNIGGPLLYGGPSRHGDCNSGGDGTSGLNGCAALNPEVRVTGARAGRVIGCCREGALPISNNIAYAEMMNSAGDTLWSNKGGGKSDGADITIAAIGTDKTLGGRFTDERGWTTKDGSLPGFGTAAQFPAHFGTTIHRVAVSPVNVSAGRGKTQLFAADAIGKSEDKNVTWAVSGSQSKSTTINTAGLLSIAADETSESLTVTAVSKINPRASSTAKVIIIDTEMYNRYAWYFGSIAVNPKANRFTISTADELAGLAQIVNGTWGGRPASDNFTGKTIKLTNDINLSAYENWMPIGNHGNNKFSGTFDGGGKIIRNLTISRPDANFQGLFGSITGGRVENLGLVNVNIRGGSHVGAVVGIVECSSFVVNTYSTGTVSGKDDVGGILGNVDCSNVINSYSTSVVSGNDGIGGVAGALGCPRWDILGRGGRRYSCMGCNSYSEINVTNTYSTGAVSGRSKVGGVVGEAWGGSVSNSYSTSAVSGTLRGVGGIAGHLQWSGVSNSWSSGVVSGGCYAGGVIGETWGGSVTNSAALNPEVKFTGACGARAADNNPTVTAGRVAGGIGNSEPQNNIAYAGNVILPAKDANVKDANFRNGVTITAAKINSDPTLGGRFTKGNGWTVRAGSLPGIGAAVRMPAHLRTGADAVSAEQARINTAMRRARAELAARQAEQARIEAQRPKMTLTGFHDYDDVQRVVMQNMQAIRYSYNRRLREKPDLKGTITVKFSIDSFGKVISAKVTESTINDSELENTIVGWVKSWTFGTIDDPIITEVVYPFILSPSPE